MFLRCLLRCLLLALSLLASSSFANVCVERDLVNRTIQLRDEYRLYQQTARTYGRRPVFKRVHRRFEDFLKAQMNSACAIPVAHLYAKLALRDMMLIDPKTKGSDILRQHGEAIFLLFDEMEKRNLLHPLTPKLRRELGGVWNERAKRLDQPKILGAYDCSLSAIWFDPLIAPMNLGSVIAHELDHLLRDKLAMGENWESTAKRASLRELFVFDEVMANVTSAILQFRMFTDSNRDYPFQRKRKFSMSSPKVFGELPYNTNFTVYAVPDSHDLSLFSKKGALARIWEHLYFERFDRLSPAQKRQTREQIAHLNEMRSIDPLIPHGGGTANPDADDYGIPVFGEFNPLFRALVGPEVLPDLKAIVAHVSAIYYPQGGIDTDRVAALIQTWIAEADPEASAAPFADLLSVPRTAKNPDPYLDLGRLLGTPSPGCRAMAEALRKEEWKGSLPRSGGNPPVLGTGEGVRPEFPDVRLGTGEGVRPEFPDVKLGTGEGVRPEFPDVKLGTGEGVRPTFNIKACAWPDRGF